MEITTVNLLDNVTISFCDTGHFPIVSPYPRSTLYLNTLPLRLDAMSRVLRFADSAMYGNTDKRGRGKPLTFNQSINYQLDDSDILDDLKIINKNKAFSMHSSRYNGIHSCLFRGLFISTHNIS